MRSDRPKGLAVRARRAFQLRSLAALAAAVASVGVTAVAYGDEIVNNLDTSVDSSLEAMSLTAGGSNGSTTLRVVQANGDGKNGCNLTGDSTLVIKAMSSAPTKATVSSENITFTSCGETKSVSVTPVAAGSSNITFTQVSNNTGGTFDLAPASFTVNVAAANVSKANQSITFGELSGRTYGDADVPLNASATSGLAVSYTSTPAAVCEIVPASLGFGPKVHLNGPGTCSVTATQAGNESFNAAQDVTQTFAVAAKTLTGSFTGSNKVYDGNTSASISSPSLDGIVGNDIVNLSVGSATFDTKDVGNGKMVTGSSFALAGTDAAKYTLGSVATTTANITKKALDVNANDLSRVFGENSPAPSATLAGFVNGENASDAAVSGDASCFVTGGPSVGEYVGGVDCQPGTLSAKNYSFAAGSKAKFTITVRPITVTADSLSKTYGDNDPLLTSEVTQGSLLPGHTLSGSLTRGAGENAGSYPITQGTLAAPNANYALTFVGGTFTIDKRLITVTAGSPSKTYGETDPPLTHTLTAGSLLPGHSLSGSVVRAAGEDAGSYAITQDTLAAPNANYVLTFVGGRFTIYQRPITVTADAKSKVFGEADPALTYQLTSGSLVGTDSLSGALARVPGESVGSYAIMKGTVSAGTNYDLTFMGANLTIGAWTLQGFHAPIGISNSFVKAPGQPAPSADASTVWQTAKGGSTIPLKFNVFAGQTERTSTTDVKSFGSTKLPTCSNSVTDGIEELASAGSTSLRYDTTGGQFIQNWKTSTVSGDTCYRVALTMQDGSAIYTFVKLRK